MNKFYNFTISNDVAELDIFAEIGENFWGDGYTFKDFQAELEQCEDKELIINLDSVGGSVFEGHNIANAIKKRKNKTTCNIYSLCASIATSIASACDEVNAFPNSLYMIHRASCGTYGNQNELRETIALLDKMDNIIADTYVTKTGLDKEVLLDYMNKESWFTAKEAKELGFIDNILEERKMVAKANITLSDLKDYKNIPDELVNKINETKNNNKQKEEAKRLAEIENKRKEIEIALALLG